MKTLSVLVLIVLAAAVAAEDTDSWPQLNVVEVARRLGVYSYLLAMEETNNLDFLANEQNITVFIPSNDAFRNVSQATRDSWRANATFYQNLMRYHVVKGRFDSTQLEDEMAYVTFADPNLQGRYVNYTGFSGNIQLYMGARITGWDNQASNGVIHLIDQVVLTPQNTSNILDVISNNKDLSKVSDAVKKTNLTSFLTRMNATTFLAPNDDAINKLPNGTWDKIVKNITQLTEILSYHINTQGTWFARGFTDGLSLPTENKNGKWAVHVNQDGISIDKSKVIVADQTASNGLYHIVDTILLPPAMTLE